MIQLKYDPILGAQVEFIEEVRRRVDNPDFDVDGFNDWLDEKLKEIEERNTSEQTEIR